VEWPWQHNFIPLLNYKFPRVRNEFFINIYINVIIGVCMDPSMDIKSDGTLEITNLVLEIREFECRLDLLFILGPFLK
jgi:hypothetical protein